MFQKIELKLWQKVILGLLAIIHLGFLITCLVQLVKEILYQDTVTTEIATANTPQAQLTQLGNYVSPLMLTSVILPGFVVGFLILFIVLPFTFLPHIIIVVSFIELVMFAVTLGRIFDRLGMDIFLADRDKTKVWLQDIYSMLENMKTNETTTTSTVILPTSPQSTLQDINDRKNIYMKIAKYLEVLIEMIDTLEVDKIINGVAIIAPVITIGFMFLVIKIKKLQTNKNQQPSVDKSANNQAVGKPGDSANPATPSQPTPSPNQPTSSPNQAPLSVGKPGEGKPI